MIIASPGYLGSVLKTQRKALGMTQKEAGQRVGLYQKTVSKLEADPASASVDSLFRLMSALQLEITVGEKPEGAAAEDW